MSALERAGSTGITTNDLLARARALAANPTQAPDTASDMPTASEGERLTGSFDHREVRRLLLAPMQHFAVASLEREFESAFNLNIEVADLDEHDLGVYLSWALTDVTWFFADRVAHLGDAEGFLREIRQPVPETIGSWVSRNEPDLQKFVALSVYDEDDKAFTELCARAVTILLGCARAWPINVDDEVPDLVEELLDKLYEWVRHPWSLTVWEVWDDEEDDFDPDPLDPPSKNRVVAKAACYLDQAYEQVNEYVSIKKQQLA